MLLGVASITSTAQTVKSIEIAGHLFNNSKNSQNATGKYYESETIITAGSNTKVSEGPTWDDATNTMSFVVASTKNTGKTATYSITFDGKHKDAVYQIPNSDFESWSGGALSETWNSFNAAQGSLAMFASSSPAPEQTDGRNGGYAVKLTSKDLTLAKANGNLTTGIVNMGNMTAANAANYNFTDRCITDGNLPFAGTPDAFEVYGKMTLGSGNTKGGRVQMILHGECGYRDPELDSQAGKKIAKASATIAASTEWTKFTGEFEYTGNTDTKQYLLVNVTTNEVPGGSAGDVLILDDIRLIYYHALTDIKVDGKTIDGFAEDKTTYEVEGNIDDIYSKIAYTVKGKGATVEKSKDGDNIYIKVLGNDYAADNTSFTTYTITKAYEPSTLLSKLVYTDEGWNEYELPLEDGKFNYTVDGTYDSVTATLKDSKATKKESYDKETCLYTITIYASDYDATTNPDAKSVYTIQFKYPEVTLGNAVVEGHTFLFSNAPDNQKATGVYYGGGVTGFNSSTDDASVETSYADGVLTLTVSAEHKTTKTYTITFAGNKKDATYQIDNGDFEEWTDDSTLGGDWNSFATATGALQAFASASPKPAKAEGYEGSAVKLTSTYVVFAAANGNLTTGAINMGSGIATDAANYNFTDFTMSESNKPLAGKPDAFEVMAKYTPGEAVSDAELKARVKLMIHGGVNYRDPEIADQAGDLVASASVIIGESGAVNEWTKFSNEFTYTGNEASELYLLADATTNPTPGASKNDELYLDNIRLIYYHALTDIKVDGKTIDGFAEDKTTYNVDATTDEVFSKITYTVKGKGATAVKAIDGNKVTITVYGNDYEADNTSFTTYTITCAKQTSIDHISIDDTTGLEVYTLGGVKVGRVSAPGLYIVNGKKTLVK